MRSRQQEAGWTSQQTTTRQPGMRLAGASNLVLLVAALSFGVLSFGATFTGNTGYVTVAIGITTGLLIGFISYGLRLSVLWTMPIAALLYILVSPSLVASGETLRVVVPSLSLLRTVSGALVFSWMDLLTLPTPIHGYSTVSIVPFASGLLASWAGLHAVLRTKYPAVALLPAGLLIAVGMLWGVYDSPWQLVIGIGYGVTAALWLSWNTYLSNRMAIGDLSSSPTSIIEVVPRTLLGAIVGLAIAFGGAWYVETSVIASPDRLVLRDTLLPPIEVQHYPSPLQSYRHLVRDKADDVLFTVSGLQPGQRIVMLALERYDGVVYNLGAEDTVNQGFTKLNSLGEVPEAVQAQRYLQAGFDYPAVMRSVALARKGGAAGGGAGGAAGSASDGGADGSDDSQFLITPVEDPFANPKLSPKQQTLTFSIDTYNDVWLPAGGNIHNVHFANKRRGGTDRALFYNPRLGALLAPQRVSKGDVYTVATEVTPVLTDEQIGGKTYGTVMLPDNTVTPDAIPTKLAEFTIDQQLAIGEVRTLTKQLSTQGFYSSQATDQARSGHRAERINALLSDKQMVGDDEQFAVTMALMAREMNIPARIVMGFYPSEQPPTAQETQTPDKTNSADQVVEILGKNTHIWVEINFDGVGWIPFDPTPPPDQAPQTSAKSKKQETQPQVIQPPDIPENPPAPAPRIDNKERQEKQATINWLLYVQYVLVAAGGSSVAIGPFALVLLYKAKRFARRSRKGSTMQRARATWQELTDTSVECGLTLPQSLTRVEGAKAMENHYAGLEMVSLARGIDHTTYAPDMVSEETATKLWDATKMAKRRMAKSLPWYKRLVATFSLASVFVARKQKLIDKAQKRKVLREAAKQRVLDKATKRKALQDAKQSKT